MKKLILLFMLISICANANYVNFGIDLYGNKCKGGLVLNDKYSIDRHSYMLLRNGPRLNKAQYYSRLQKIMRRRYELHRKLDK